MCFLKNINCHFCNSFINKTWNIDLQDNLYVQYAGKKHNTELKTFIKQYSRLQPGSAAWFTKTGALKCKAIIHAVWTARDKTVQSRAREFKNSRKAIRTILNLAMENDLRKNY